VNKIKNFTLRHVVITHNRRKEMRQSKNIVFQSLEGIVSLEEHFVAGPKKTVLFE
jgi:hypothetical protein